ncbi:hypothetical protein HDU77_007055 [Chytriomyces hyalinus]|nr:hypothetical protein HDU77_007055 [Chytriomyces hyalinus]
MSVVVRIVKESTGEGMDCMVNPYAPVAQTAEQVARMLGMEGPEGKTRDTRGRFVLRSEGVTLRDTRALRAALQLGQHKQSQGRGPSGAGTTPMWLSVCESPVLLAVDMQAVLRTMYLHGKEDGGGVGVDSVDGTRIANAALFALVSLIKDTEFFEAFVVTRDGLESLLAVIMRLVGPVVRRTSPCACADALSQHESLVAGNTADQGRMTHAPSCTYPIQIEMLTNALSALLTMLELHDSTHSTRFNDTPAVLNALLSIVLVEPPLSVLINPASAILIRLLLLQSLPPNSNALSFDSNSKVPAQNSFWPQIADFITASPNFTSALIDRLTHSEDYSLQVTTLSLLNAFVHKSLYSSNPAASSQLSSFTSASSASSVTARASTGSTAFSNTLSKQPTFSFLECLEEHKFRTALVSLTRKQQLLSDPANDELRRLIVEFQRLLVKHWSRSKRTTIATSVGGAATHLSSIDPSVSSEHGVSGVKKKWDVRYFPESRLIAEIWKSVVSASLDSNDAQASSPPLSMSTAANMRWKKLGFDNENPRKEFSRVGLFGLQMMHSFVMTHTDLMARFLREQSVKPLEKRCPFGKACVEVVELLSDFWEISSGYPTTTSVQPLLLEFDTIFHISLRLYLRLWLDMEAKNMSGSEDVIRVAAAVGFHFRACVASSSQLASVGTQLVHFEREMLSVPYSVIRERQLKEVSNDDVLMSRLAVRTLREKLYKQNYEFVKAQRITLIMQGAWFPAVNEKGRVKNVHRFYRLSPNAKVLHYGEFKSEAPPTNLPKPELQNLKHKIDITHVTEVLSGFSSPIFSSKRKTVQEDSSLCFSIATSISANSTTSYSRSTNPESLADFVCHTKREYSEWIDAFNMLLDKNISTQETATLILQLTDLELKVALLGITGSGLSVPSVAPELGDPPIPSVPFYYRGGGDGGSDDGREARMGGLQSLVSDMKVRELLDVYESGDDE